MVFNRCKIAKSPIDPFSMVANSKFILLLFAAAFCGRKICTKIIKKIFTLHP
jgi:hypothetical protein